MAKKAAWTLITIILIFAGAAVVWQVTGAQDGRSDFPETGHGLSGEFYNHYWTAEDPILVYGYPITDPITDATTDKVVQYFQRAVFVLHPEEPQGSRVKLAPLGEYFYEAGEPIEQTGKLSNCKKFAETGFRVCYAFWEFFKANGGVEQFGYPISNFEHQYGRIVQYFEHARFEWYPELPSGRRVRLADLGEEYFYLIGMDHKILGSNRPRTILDLHVRAYPYDPITTLQGAQTIYVLVQDQNRLPVPNAEVKVSVRFPSGVVKSYPMTETNNRGIASVSFDLTTFVPGRALVLVNVTYEKLEPASTTTSYRVWW